jgi:Subtilase family
MSQLIISVPNDRQAPTYNAGRTAAEHLQRPQAALRDLQVIHKAELLSYMNQHHIKGTDAIDKLPFAYHLVEVPDGDLAGAAARILRWHNNRTGGQRDHGYVERVEENRVLMASAPTVDLGTGFSFTPQHDAYLKMLGLDPTARPTTNDGDDVRVAIIDSGIEPGASVNRKGYKDVIDASSTGPQDDSGHGTAMAMIVNAVAPKAQIHVIRAFEKKYALIFDVMAGIGAAYYDVKAHVINCSLGFNDLQFRCSICGGTGGGRSKTFEDYLKHLANSVSTISPPPPQPVIVAAVGNDYSPSNLATFRAPAHYDSTVAIGAITSGYTLSPFSNRGTYKNLYFLLPGGDDTILPSGTPSEAIGTASAGSTYCIGTSPAAAYATGLLALYRAETRYQSLDTNDFLDAMASQCDTSCIPGYSTTDHGKGCLYFH